MINKTKQKTYKGEKYIYLYMGYKFALSSVTKNIKVGHDNGCKNGFQFERYFKIQEYKGKTLLIETKSSKGFADFTRTFIIYCPTALNPSICDYINEDFENCGQGWTH